MKKITNKNLKQKSGKGLPVFIGSFISTNLVGFSYLSKKVVITMRGLILFIIMLGIAYIPFKCMDNEEVVESVPDNEIQEYIQG